MLYKEFRLEWSKWSKMELPRRHLGLCQMRCCAFIRLGCGSNYPPIREASVLATGHSSRRLVRPNLFHFFHDDDTAQVNAGTANGIVRRRSVTENPANIKRVATEQIDQRISGSFEWLSSSQSPRMPKLFSRTVPCFVKGQFWLVFQVVD
jgi:hypothetical protein